jgi:PAS domain S-box-containing protein
MTDKSLFSEENDTGSIFRNLSVRKKIGVGFGGLILLMTVSIGFTLFKLSEVADITQSVIEERQPTANLFQRLNQDLNLVTSLLNGYLLTGESELREEYGIIETDISEILAELRFQDTSLNGEIAPEQIQQADELFGKFRTYANALFGLRDNNAINSGMILAQDTLNGPANTFIAHVNTLLTSDDIDLDDPRMLKAYTTLQELRYVWTQMMSSLRLFIITQSDGLLTNFKTFSNRSDELLTELMEMDVELGFGELEEMVEMRAEYVSKLPPVLDIFASDNWRADSFLIKTELRPVLEELRAIFESIADEQLHKAKESGASLTEANEQIQFSTIIILAIALQIGVLLAIRITGDIVPPIHRLMEAAKNVAQGDLNSEVMVTSQDEIGQLGNSFNDMINDLREAALNELKYFDELNNINHELEERVQKRTEELEQNETKIRAILDNIGEGIIVLDENGTIESLNPAAEAIFDMEEDDAIGLNSALLVSNADINNASASDQYDDTINGAFKCSDSQQPIEYEGVRSDGSTFPLELVVSAMNIGDKHLRVCIMRDVTARKETEATLADAQGQLVDAAHKSGMAEMATGVLHNIGNILNSVNLAGEEIYRVAGNSKISGLLKANDMLQQHENDMGEFLSQDARGKKLPEYFIKMGKVLNTEISNIRDESKELIAKTTMMKEVISTQQAYAKSGFHSEQLNLQELVEDALKIQESSLKKWGVKLNTHFADIPICTGQKSKLLQVITNLIKNAKEAMNDNDQFNRPKELNIETGMFNDSAIYLKIQDNGCGIDKEQLAKIFNHGFTTKESGHGFGLHSSANAMTEMKGSLKVDSEGVQKGACFTVTIPTGKASKAA